MIIWLFYLSPASLLLFGFLLLIFNMNQHIFPRWKIQHLKVHLKLPIAQLPVKARHLTIVIPQKPENLRSELLTDVQTTKFSLNQPDHQLIVSGESRVIDILLLTHSDIQPIKIFEDFFE